MLAPGTASRPPRGSECAIPTATRTYKSVCQAYRRMAASKARAYNAKMKVKQDQFKLNQKISKNFVAGKTTRL